MDEAQKLLRQLQLDLKRPRVTALERERAANDVQTILARLTHEQYKVCDFSGKNVFCIPERVSEYYIAMADYCRAARTWATLLRALDVHVHATVVDFCSGWAPKVTFAFCYLQYRGTVVLLDKDTGAMKQLTQFTDLFAPSFSLRALKADVLNPPKKQFSLLIANHVLDDLLLDLYCRTHRVDISKIYKDEQALKSVWESLLRDRSELRTTFAPKIGRVLLGLTSKGGILAITQYRSLIDRLLDMDDAVEFCTELFHELRLFLLAHGCTEDTEVVSRALRPMKDRYFRSSECIVLRKTS